MDCLTADLFSAPVYPNGDIHLSSLLRQMGYLAGRDVDRHGFSYQALLQRDMVFVLISTTLRLSHPLAPELPVFLETVAVGQKGPYFVRDFFFSQGGSLVGDAVTHWALMSFSQRRLLRPSVLPELTPDPPRSRAAASFRKPAGGELTSLGRHIVRLSDLDRNRHMNNAAYIDTAANALPAEVCNRSFSGCHVEYRRECLPGDEILLTGCPLENGWQVTGHAENQHCFDVFFTFFSPSAKF